MVAESFWKFDFLLYTTKINWAWTLDASEISCWMHHNNTSLCGPWRGSLRDLLSWQSGTVELTDRHCMSTCGRVRELSESRPTEGCDTIPDWWVKEWDMQKNGRWKLLLKKEWMVEPMRWQDMPPRIRDRNSFPAFCFRVRSGYSSAALGLPQGTIPKPIPKCCHKKLVLAVSGPYCTCNNYWNNANIRSDKCRTYFNVPYCSIFTHCPIDTACQTYTTNHWRDFHLF